MSRAHRVQPPGTAVAVLLWLRAAAAAPPLECRSQDPSHPVARSVDREHLRLMQQDFEGLPAALLLQLGAAVAAALLGGLQADVSGTFRPIRLADAPK